MFVEHENDQAERLQRSITASASLLELLRLHHPERSPPDTTKTACEAVARSEPEKVESVPAPRTFIAVGPSPDIAASSPGPQRRAPKIEEIQRVVARQYDLRRIDLLSSRRTANVVRPRQVAMYLAKTLTLHSLPQIGRRFGGRDHTTVLHAVRKIGELVRKDGSAAARIAAIRAAVLALPTLASPLCPLCHQGTGAFV